MPKVFATGFGLEHAICVFDHFDITGVYLSSQRFLESAPVSLSDSLCLAISDSPFFVASKSDLDFAEVFTITNAIPIATERIIKSMEQTEIHVANPPLRITPDICTGCPGYCVLFNHLCALAEKAKRKAGKGAKYRCRVDECRSARLLHELMHFLGLRFAWLKEENVPLEAIGKLLSMTNVIIDVRRNLSE
jgi:hypothetical protein